MGDVLLSGMLDLKGPLDLVPTAGGKVKATGSAVLVELQRGIGPSHGTAPPVPLPPPAPVDTGADVWVFRSFNSTVTAANKAIVTQGMCAHGNPGTATWPGMVQASVGNPGVTVNGVPMNVVGDLGTILPTGAPASLTSDGQ
jgi:hypothetical protein